MTSGSIVAAGLGAASPSLLRLAIGLETGDSLPERSYLLGLAIFVLLGCIVGWLFDERDLKKAFYTGIGLPALIQLGISELARETPVALGPAPATLPADSGRIAASRTASVGSALRLASLRHDGPRRLFLVVASGRPDQVRIEFSDRVGARVVRTPNVKNDRILTFDVPDRAIAFRVIVRGSYAEARRLRPDPTDSFRVEVTQKRWSGLKRALGADGASRYEVSVRSLRGSVDGS